MTAYIVLGIESARNTLCVVFKTHVVWESRFTTFGKELFEDNVKVITELARVALA